MEFPIKPSKVQKLLKVTKKDSIALNNITKAEILNL